MNKHEIYIQEEHLYVMFKLCANFDIWELKLC